MSFYSQLAATAARLLADKGQAVTFSRTTGATYSPVTGAHTGGTPTSFTGNGAAFDYNKSEIDGETVQAGDIRLMLEATSAAPQIDDTATVDGVEYRVMSVFESSPGGVVTHYEVQLRL